MCLIDLEEMSVYMKPEELAPSNKVCVDATRSDRNISISAAYCCSIEGESREGKGTIGIESDIWSCVRGCDCSASLMVARTPMTGTPILTLSTRSASKAYVVSIMRRLQ